eukprot:CAMPEP_0182428792 /NCGR_PEP_ID=MMETSP1167-20130531/23637_1 /TAXON_ID=2988 /ORGANISM="Mallomonas Sp, Strain CCMP3275" /LENGTH=87 /DNA_ID=CAMNT_0024611893 /DNA_START=84 /DNA_END=344 /DNA_ORIENTATION=+
MSVPLRSDYGTIPRQQTESGRLLLESQRTASNTEKIGSEVLEELATQKGMLDDADLNVKSMQNITKSARRAINEMKNKAFREKLCLW